MKVSQAQKEEIRLKLVQAAVALFNEKGFHAATMREISTKAGFSPGTIYSYFPNKEKIFFAYFEEKQKEMLASLKDIEDFSIFNLKEKLQTILEIQLEVYTPDREFVETTFKALMDTPMRSFTELKPTKDAFASLVDDIFTKAVDAQEISPQPFGSFLANLFWDYKNLIVFYWLRDTTAGFSNTSRLIDMSLDLYIAALKSDLVTKSVDIVSFLIRSHVYGNIEKLYELMGLMRMGKGPFPETRDG